MNKKVTEQYLFDALSFTEAEVKAIEEITPFILGELTVLTIKNQDTIKSFLHLMQTPTNGFRVS